MKNNELILRAETRADWDEVEFLTREAFWDVYKPGCDEHLVVHTMRNDPAVIPELCTVAELDDLIVGHIFYTRVRIAYDGGAQEAAAFGPISVLPEVQKQGVGSAMIKYTLPQAARMGFPGVLITGNPDYYHRFGFYDGARHGIVMPDGSGGPWLMAQEFIPGALHRGCLHFAPQFDTDPAQLAEFETHFPAKEKKFPK